MSEGNTAKAGRGQKGKSVEALQAAVVWANPSGNGEPLWGLLKGNNVEKSAFGENRSGDLLENEAPGKGYFGFFFGKRQLVGNKRFLLTCSPEIQQRG